MVGGGLSQLRQQQQAQRFDRSEIQLGRERVRNNSISLAGDGRVGHARFLHQFQVAKDGSSADAELRGEIVGSYGVSCAAKQADEANEPRDAPGDDGRRIKRLTPPLLVRLRRFHRTSLFATRLRFLPLGYGAPARRLMRR